MIFFKFYVNFVSVSFFFSESPFSYLAFFCSASMELCSASENGVMVGLFHFLFLFVQMAG